MNDILLSVKNLKVSLSGEKIIDNLSFDVKEGEIFTILGQNGSGKSVLIKTILGFFPYLGEIKWSKNLKIGYLPQGLTHLNVKGLPLNIRDFFSLKNKDNKIEEIISFLNMVGLDENILEKNIGNLSGGQFQRVLIAWVLISKPEIIFLDEPTTGIDIGGGETVNSLMYEINKKKNITIFLVTHDMNIVFKYSNHVLCLNTRSHYCFGEPEEILTQEKMKETFGEFKYYKHL
jgi:zinc transport system ATP-binding protein